MTSRKTKFIAIALFLLLIATFIVCVANISTDNVAEAAVLKQGSRGELVRQVQTKLIRWGYMSGSADGIFGAKTKAGVVYFQKKNGLYADGIVGTKTARALGINLNSASSSSTTQSSDLNLLARLIHGEARGEPYVGQVAVGAVVLNRVKSASFPNTIAGVIYQAGAFDAVNDGQINLTPSQSCINAARDALNGWDPSYGCLYYYNPRTATNKWMLAREVKLSIGNHAFC